MYRKFEKVETQEESKVSIKEQKEENQDSKEMK